MSIVQDYDADHYRLKFNFKDSVINLPIAIVGTSTKQIQKNHNQFSGKLANAEKKDERGKKQFDKHLKSHIDKTIEEVRKDLIRQELIGFNRTLANPDMLRFGLPNFGLINLDILIKVNPLDYFALQPNFIDQNGTIYKAPENLRVLLLNQNSYLNARRSAIPVYLRSILIVLLQNDHIGVLSLHEGLPNKIEKMTVFDISNMSSSEVSKLILSQNAPN